MDKLEELGLDENTIVIFSSDNGPVLDDGYADRAIELCGDHRPAGPLRGRAASFTRPRKRYWLETYTSKR